MNCITSTLTASQRDARAQCRYTPSLFRPKKHCTTSSTKLLLSPKKPQAGFSLLSTRTQSPVSNHSKSLSRSSFRAGGEDENCCPVEVREEYVLRERNEEEGQLIRVCDSLLGDLENARADCVKKDADQRSLRSELSSARSEIQHLKQQLFASSRRVPDQSFSSDSSVSFVLASELEYTLDRTKREMVLLQTKKLTETQDRLLATQALLDQANAKVATLMSENKSLRLAVEESRYREIALKNTAALTEEKIKQERSITSELSKQLGATQDQMVTAVGKLVALETADAEVRKDLVEAQRQLAEQETLIRELKSECEQLRFYGSDSSSQDINFRKLCQFLLSKDCFQRLTQLLGSDFSVLVARYEKEIAQWENKAKALETSLEVMEMQLEAAVYNRHN